MSELEVGDFFFFALGKRKLLWARILKGSFGMRFKKEERKIELCKTLGDRCHLQVTAILERSDGL